MDAIKILGYSGYWMEIGNWNGNVISDALMAVKYRISDSDNGFVINENPASLGFITPVVSELPEELPINDRAIVAGDIFTKMFGLNKNPVVNYEITALNECEYLEDEGYHIFTQLSSNNSIVYKLDVIGEQILYFDCFNGGSNNLEEPINNAFSVYVNGKPVTQSYPSQNKNGMIELGTFKNEPVTVLLQLNKNISCYSFGVFGFDLNAIKNAVKSVEQSKVDIKPNCITTEIPSDYSGELFISLPYSDGYKVTLNAKKIDYQRKLTGVMGITVDGGGELKISFITPKFVLGLIISVFGIIALVALYLLWDKLDYLPDLVKKSVFILFVSVFAAFLIIIYIMPVVANLVS